MAEDPNEQNKPNEKSRIEMLRQKLDSKRAQKKRDRSRLKRKRYGLPTDFSNIKRRSEKKLPETRDDGSYVIKAPEPEPSFLGSSPFRKLFFVSLIFFVFAGGIAGYLVWSDSNVVSTDNVSFEVQTARSVDAGEETNVQVLITNNNEIALKRPRLMVEFPEGAREVNNINEAVTNKNLQLENIMPGETRERNLPITFFGDENTSKSVKASLQYSLDNSNAIFVKNAAKEIRLASSPVALDVEVLREAPSDQDLELSVTLSSNTSRPVNDLVFETDFPADFTFRSSDPVPSAGQNFWRFDTLNPGEQKTINIVGRIRGLDTQRKVFRFKTGLQGDVERGVGIPYSIAQEEVQIEAPFASVNIDAGGGDDARPNTVYPGTTLGGGLNWSNDSGSTLTNLEILLSVEGDLIDRSTLEALDGFYRSQDDTLLWNTRTRDDFDVVSAGAVGDLRFEFDLYSPFSDEALEAVDSRANLNVTIRAQRISESGVSEDLEAYVSKEIQVNSKVRLDARAAHDESPFSEFGPIPPRVDEETSYAVFWTLENSLNNVEDARVSARLPTYVNWEGNITPSDENVSYNDTTGRVTWNVGELAEKTGATSAPRQVAFQVSFRPSLGQVNDVPEILSETIFEGTDAFTGSLLREVRDPLTTQSRDSDRNEAAVRE